MKFALGKLGWTPYEYYTSLPIEFYAACEGYQERYKENMLPIRFGSYRVAESMAGTKALGSIERFWPIEDKPKSNQPPLTKEQIEDIFKRHNIKVK